MDDVDLDVVDVHELAVVRHALHVQQAAGDLDHLAHGLDGPTAPDPDLRGERVPPGADSELDPPGREIVQRREGRGEQPDVSRPGVHDAGADRDPVRDGRERGHRDGCLPHEAAFACQTASNPHDSASCA